MTSTEEEITFRTLDGLHLAGTLVTPAAPSDHAVVLVHGGGVTREEGGFFARLASGLSDAGLASLRFDLRGHGESEGRKVELTLSAVLNDIRVALWHVGDVTGVAHLSLLGTSFTGGVTAYYAAKCPAEISRLVLLNPRFNYKERTIDGSPVWQDDALTDELSDRLERVLAGVR